MENGKTRNSTEFIFSVLNDATHTYSYKPYKAIKYFLIYRCTRCEDAIQIASTTKSISPQNKHMIFGGCGAVWKPSSNGDTLVLTKKRAKYKRHRYIKTIVKATS